MLSTSSRRRHMNARGRSRPEVEARAPKPAEVRITKPAWRGTLLPGTDADTWLAAAFADFEPTTSLENALCTKCAEKDLPKQDRERLELKLFTARSRYLTAVERLGRDVPLAATKAELATSEWYDIAAGKGVLLLSALRRHLGAEKFDGMMDEFGRHHGGKPASTDAFRLAVAKAAGKSMDEFFRGWLDEAGLPDGAIAPAGRSIPSKTNRKGASSSTAQRKTFKSIARPPIVAAVDRAAGATLRRRSCATTS